MHNKLTKLQTSYFAIFLLIIFTGSCYLLSTMLTPFIISAFLAYVFDPLVDRLVRKGVSRLVAVTIVFMLIFAIIGALFLILIPTIQNQVNAILSVLPHQFAEFQKKTWPWLMSTLGIQNNLNDMMKEWMSSNLSKVGNFSTSTFQFLLISSKHILEVIINFILVPVVTFYLLLDWNVLIKKIHDLIPRHIEKKVVALAKSCDLVLSAFFRGQLLVMLSLCVIYAIALSIIGLQAAVVIGLIAGIASLVPYLGSILGFIIAIIASIVQFGTLNSILMVAIIFAVGHLIENFYLAPKFIGDRVGLHPVAVIFAVLAGANLFGFIGVLLALPVASIIVVLLKNLSNYYYSSSYYNG